ncbi:MAG: ABC transporter ATP-binding protein/permease [Propionibacteriaceae bacterium]|jgi:ABC-type multidrug transport system fused ATPase/permease subunit|nr:ABC transporter ATP-binding protein/permease [Propionibacteriaceae bacterium]
MKLFPPDIHAYTQVTSTGATAAARPDEEVPDTRSPLRFVLWLLWQQKGLIAITTILISVWWLPGSLNPRILTMVIDQGIIAGNWSVTWRWTLVMVAIIVVGVAANTAASNISVSSWLVSMFRVTKLVARKVTQMSHVVTRRVPAGEMLSVASSDADAFGAIAESFGRVLAAFLSFLLVSVIVLREHVMLGLVMLIATPLIVILTTPALRPLQRAQMVERERSSKLTGMAVDIVSGLRILRGVGGERTFGDNYARQSQSVRQAGVRTGSWWAVVDAMGTVTNGALLVGLTWLGLREVQLGHLTIGEMVGFFGYAMFLQRPVQTFFDAFQKWTASLVSAEKTIGLLSQEPPWPAQSSAAVVAEGQLIDHPSGFVADPGQLTIIVSAVPDDSAALADRLGRYLPADIERVDLGVSRELKGSAEKQEWQKRAAARAQQVRQDETLAAGDWGVTLDGVDIAQIPLPEVRRRIQVSDAGAVVFAGTLQSLIDPLHSHSRDQAEQALWAASAEDVWDAFADGWQGRIDERGRGLSGGQRQRMVLARSLLLDPEVLVLVEPTSAVDAHTEARIAERLPDFRSGRTTIMTTVSPLWLRQADAIAFLVDGQVLASGSHADLMANCPPYRAVVVRDDSQATAGGGDAASASPTAADSTADHLAGERR